jgi:hypothetical protein
VAGWRGRSGEQQLSAQATLSIATVSAPFSTWPPNQTEAARCRAPLTPSHDLDPNPVA